jgi:very-short-patch-repair endonuclease
LMVLRFDDRQVLVETESVVEEIFRTVSRKTLP